MSVYRGLARPERGFDLLQVRWAHVEVPQLIRAFRLKSHCGDRAHHARIIEAGRAQDAIDGRALSRPAGARTRPSGVSTPSSSSSRIAREVERWRPSCSGS